MATVVNEMEIAAAASIYDIAGAAADEYDDDDDDDDSLDIDGRDIYLSDLSDYFDEDAHLLGTASKVQELSLDEVSYDRDIKNINVVASHAARLNTVASIQVNPSRQARGRPRFDPSALARLANIPTSDPKDPTFVPKK
jgi:hypothetical protein